MGGKPRKLPTRADGSLTVALPKGRVLSKVVSLLSRAGYDTAPITAKTRKLVRDTGELRVLIVRQADVPTYVSHGAADVGVVGSDVLLEADLPLYEPLDLGIGRCRMVLAEWRKNRTRGSDRVRHLRVASKYPRITRRYLQAKGVAAEVVKLSGAVELSPLLGLTDQIVDLVETGETMRQNGLVEVETILEVSSRLVVNPASFRLRTAQVHALVERLAAQL